jgi:putative hydrolase of the HAD superfamily
VDAPRRAGNRDELTFEVSAPERAVAAAILAVVSQRWVFFDVGGTLLDPSPSFAERFAMVLADYGHDVDVATIRAELDTLPDRFARAANEGDRWTTSLDRSRRFWGSVYESVLERVGVPAGDGLSNVLYETFTSLATYSLFADVLDTLAALRAHGDRLGVISNFEAWLPDLLGHLGVRDRFEVVVISGIEGIEKPDPAIFELALRRAGIPAADATYVGDVPALDVHPAVALGMRAVLLDRRDRYPEHSGPRIDDLGLLPSIMAAAG